MSTCGIGLGGKYTTALAGASNVYLVPCLFAKGVYELKEDESRVPDFVKVSSSYRVPSLSMEMSSTLQPGHGVNEARM